MEIECIGEVLENGRILTDPPISDKIKVGSRIKIKIVVQEKERKKKKELSPAAKRLLEKMQKARPLGLPDNPHELSHSVLAEERMEEKISCME